MVLAAYIALSPVTGLSCHRRLAKLLSRDLTPASGRQDHTTSPSASATLVLRRRRIHRIPLPTFVTTRTPLLSRRDGTSRKFDLPDGESEIFFAGRLDKKIASGATDLPVGQIT
jgi:hypothetical protein